MEQNPRLLFLHEGELELRLLQWQHQNMYHVVCFLEYNTSAKFQLLCLSIYRDITDFVFFTPIREGPLEKLLGDGENTKKKIVQEKMPEKISTSRGGRKNSCRRKFNLQGKMSRN